MFRRGPALLLIALAAALYGWALYAKPITTSHEARQAQTARIMAASGWPWDAKPVSVVPVTAPAPPSEGSDPQPQTGAEPILVNPWLVPTLNGAVRLQKAPLPYWLSAICFKLFGVGEFAARLPSAVMGVLGALLAGDLARLLLRRRSARTLAIVAWLSGYFVLTEYAKAMADPPLAFFTLAAFWAWVRMTRTRTWTFPLLFWTALALGTLAKGPVVLLHVGLAAVAYFVATRRYPRQFLPHLIGLAIYIAICLPWPLYVMRNVEHALEIWRSESIDRFGQNTDGDRPWWYYLPGILLISAPWTPLVLLALYRNARRLRPAAFPALWLLLTVAAFSFSHAKKYAYLLPVMPAVVLMAVQGVYVLTAWARSRSRPRSVPTDSGTPQTATPTRPASGPAKWATRNPFVRWFYVLATLAGLVTLTIMASADVSKARSRSIAPVCRAAGEYLRSHPDVVVDLNGLTEEAAFYLPINTPYAYDAPKALIFGETASPADNPKVLASRLRGRTIQSVERIPLGINGGTKGWHVAVVTSVPITP